MLTPTLTLLFRSPLRFQAGLTDIPQYATQATWQVADNSAFTGTLIVNTTTSADGWGILEYSIPSGDESDTFYIRAKVGGDVPTLDENGGVALDENGDEIYTFTESGWATYITSVPDAAPATPTIEQLVSTPQRIGVNISNYPSDASDATFQFSVTANATTRWDSGNIVKEVTVPGTFYEYRVAEANRETTHYIRAKVRRIEDFDDGDPVGTDSSWSSTLTVTRAGAIRPVDLDYDLTAYETAGTYTYTVPTGARQVRVTLVGGGGGGRGGNGNAASSDGGHGGGGAHIAEKWLVVTPGTSLSVVVGAGGTGGSGANASGTGRTNGGDGGTTSIAYSGTTLLRAYGGRGGKSSGGAGGGFLNNSSATPSGGLGASSTDAPGEYGGGAGADATAGAIGADGGSSAYGGGGGGAGGGVGSGTAYDGGTGGDGSAAGPLNGGSAGIVGNAASPAATPGDDASDPIYCGGGGGGGGGGTTQSGTNGRPGGNPGGGGGGGGGGGTGRAGGSGGAGGAGAAYILAL